MIRKEYKVELFRITKQICYSAKELESFINLVCKSGWIVKSVTFHSEILTYEIIFERSIKVE